MVMNYLTADHGLGMKARTRRHCKEKHQRRKGKKLKTDDLWINPHFLSLPCYKNHLTPFCRWTEKSVTPSLAIYFARKILIWV